MAVILTITSSGKTVTTAQHVVLSGNPIRISVAGDPAPAGATKHMHMLKIESTDGKLIGAPFYNAIAVPASYVTKFNIQGYVDQPAARLFQWPVTDAIISRDDPTLAIKVTGGERYIDSNGDLQEIWNVSGTNLIVLKGGISQRQEDIWIAGSTDFYETYLLPGLFLTQRPQDDYVHPYQPVKLWYLDIGNTDTPNTKLRFVCNYSDGTSATTDINISPDDGELHELNVNPYHNGIDMVNESGAKLLNWTVSIYVATELMSDVRRFQYDYRYCERPFWLLFANSLGGIDDVYLAGRAVEGFEASGTEVYVPAQYTNTIFDRTLVVPNKQGRNTYTINSGFKSATQMLHLRDLLLSREAWLLYPNNGVTNYYVIPVNIGNSKAELVDRINDLWTIDIELLEAHSSQFSFDNRRY